MIVLEGSDSYTVPTVVTDRLRLTTWTEADIPAYVDMQSDPEMSRWTGRPGATYNGVWGMFAHQIGHWALNGFGMWTAHDRETGRFVGRMGLYREPSWPGVEVAWTVRHDLWGQGLATEGGDAALWYGFTHRGLDEVVSLMHERNAASRRVAEKLGLTLIRIEPMAIFDGRPTCLYRIDRRTWAARQS